MNKIAIIGCGGSGKSTLSKTLGELLSIPIYHLDCLYWKPKWKPSEHKDFAKKQEEIISAKQWIIDGNYAKTLDIRLNGADTIIFLDLPNFTCLWNVIKRYFRYRNQTRSDMTLGNNERITLEFLRYVWTYKSQRQPLLIQKLSNLESSKDVVVLTSRSEIEKFIKTIKNKPNSL